MIEGLIEHTADGPVLVGGFSPSSGHHHFPLASRCPYSGAGDVERVLLPTTGQLWLWTAITTPPPGYAGDVPYGFGVVALDGIDLRVVARLTESDPSALAEGQAMRLTTAALPDDDGTSLEVWAFEAAS